MQTQLFTDEQKEEIKKLVHEALVEFFAVKGGLVKNIIVTVATVVGAVAAIGVAGKWILALFGIGYIGK